MANAASTAHATAWESLFSNYRNLTQQLEQARPHERDALERAITAAQDDLLDIPAPSFAAVMCKLEMLWDTEIHGLDQASEERRLVLEDLEGLIQAQRELLG